MCVRSPLVFFVVTKTSFYVMNGSQYYLYFFHGIKMEKLIRQKCKTLNIVVSAIRNKTEYISPKGN